MFSYRAVRNLLLKGQLWSTRRLLWLLPRRQSVPTSLNVNTEEAEMQLEPHFSHLARESQHNWRLSGLRLHMRVAQPVVELSTNVLTEVPQLAVCRSAGLVAFRFSKHVIKIGSSGCSYTHAKSCKSTVQLHVRIRCCQSSSHSKELASVVMYGRRAYMGATLSD